MRLRLLGALWMALIGAEARAQPVPDGYVDATAVVPGLDVDLAIQATTTLSVVPTLPEPQPRLEGHHVRSVYGWRAVLWTS